MHLIILYALRFWRRFGAQLSIKPVLGAIVPFG